MYTSKLRKAISFFAEHAGYCTPPGRMTCALHLAQAEAIARETDAVFDWQPDCDEPIENMLDSSVFRSPVEFARYCDKYREDVWSCILRSADGEVLASLGAIIGAPRDYRRVVEAELALEAFGHDPQAHRSNMLAKDILAILNIKSSHPKLAEISDAICAELSAGREV